MFEEDKELRDLITKCADCLDEDVRFDYMVNCLVLKSRQGMTVKEIFDEEFKSKEEFEKELQDQLE